MGMHRPMVFGNDQDEHEWVVVLRGLARLTIEDECVALKPGDFINIPAQPPTPIEWTTPDEPTIWLAIFLSMDRSRSD